MILNHLRCYCHIYIKECWWKRLENFSNTFFISKFIANAHTLVGFVSPDLTFFRIYPLFVSQTPVKCLQEVKSKRRYSHPVLVGFRNADSKPLQKNHPFQEAKLGAFSSRCSNQSAFLHTLCSRALKHNHGCVSLKSSFFLAERYRF